MALVEPPSTAPPRFCYGFIVLAVAAGIVVVAGAIRDSAGDYALAFVMAGWIAMAVGVAALLIRRPGRAARAAVSA